MNFIIFIKAIRVNTNLNCYVYTKTECDKNASGC